MRWAALVFITGAWFTAEGMPLPEIKLGASRQAVEVYMTHWYSGFVSTSSVFLECTVMEVSSEVNTSPRQTWLSESCIVRVERAFGRMEQLEGISTAVLKAGYEHSRHDTVDPGWGRLRHLQKGQRILVLLHEYEEAPSFGFEALIEPRLV